MSVRRQSVTSIMTNTAASSVNCSTSVTAVDSSMLAAVVTLSVARAWMSPAGCRSR